MSGATHPAGGPRLYDRTAELAAVARLSARAAAGRGGVLFVTGNPGEGRTALLARAAYDFPGRAYRVSAPHHRGPWSAARALFTELAATPAAGRRALRLARSEGGFARAVAAFATEVEAVLICVDDLHLWDAHSRAALAAAWRETGMRRPGRVGWLVSAARHHRFPEVSAAETVRLGRLTTSGARALLDDLCPGAAAAPVGERLLDEAAGHPGVLAAAVRRLTAPQLSGARPLPRPAVDDTVLTEVYGGLLERLPAASRRLLATVAVVALAGRAGAGADGLSTVAYGVGGGGGSAPVGARGTRAPAEPLEGLVADGLLRRRRGGAVGFEDPFLGRAALASARQPRRGRTGGGGARAAGGAPRGHNGRGHRRDAYGGRPGHGRGSPLGPPAGRGCARAGGGAPCRPAGAVRRRARALAGRPGPCAAGPGACGAGRRPGHGRP
ncbi:ATP-binding protein [Streptomyces sp. NPDC056480]|uniref:ATP-binding protein n=1 Tax=Streptomyces sp. NPDC056480 TaxID=3345833 RepID=UPI00369D382B